MKYIVDIKGKIEGDYEIIGKYEESSQGEIKCPINLNSFILEYPFENTFTGESCETAKAYGDCYHCFASAIAKRDRMIRENARPQGEWIYHGLENCLWGQMECPFCHRRSNRDADFCQYCGASMKGAIKDE